ncbi:CTF77 [Hepatospora eriocheir]|uniref:CTF77 n=1 Tax=Hepatospora eriocheir TaxID=1081669 RepID=A0A1X0QDH9_9MICR|nr:CTF77 [Hepatospora eriocheir]
MKKISDIYEEGKRLQDLNDKSGLEKFFNKYLKTSADSRVWNLYVNYVKNDKKIHLAQVYQFIVNYLEHSYESFEFVKECIKELNKTSLEEGKIDKIRRIYTKFVKVPHNKLSELFREYEQWEISVNKINAKSMIEEVQPYYINAMTVYQKISQSLKSKNFYKLIDIEVSNPLKLNKKSFDNRLNFILNYLLLNNYNYEEIEILRSIYLNNISNVEVINSCLHQYWFSFHLKKNLFDFSRKNDLTAINYLNWVVQNEGIESYRNKFKEMKNDYTFRVYIYAAELEMRNNSINAYNILNEAFEKYPNESLLNEMFFKMFYKANDDEKIRLLFKKLNKTDKIWKMMINYELRFGDFNEYKNLLSNYNQNNRDLLKSCFYDDENNKIEIEENSLRIISNIKKSFEYLDLKLPVSDILSDFISKLPNLPENENILKDVEVNKIIELIKRIE